MRSVARKDLPELRPTGRSYVDRTRGGWLSGPAVERHVFRRRRGARVALALLVLAAVVALAWWWPGR